MERRDIRMISLITRLTGLRRLISRSGQHFIAPFYHVVSDDSLPHIRHLYTCRGTRDFEKDLDDLLSYFEPVGYTELRKGGISVLKKPAMLLTFDDGLAECHGIIAPLLKRKGIPALFFLNNNFIDNKGLFYRYKVSLLIDEIEKDPSVLAKAAVYLRVPEGQVRDLLLSVSYSQQVLLNALADDLKLDFYKYMGNRPVYMTSDEIKELIGWGFEIGSHGLDHPRMDQMKPDKIIEHVLTSVMDLQKRFMVNVTGFAFPFSSTGIPDKVIGTLLKQQLTLFGISGIRQTGTDRFIQRIDMEAFGIPALEVLKIKYLHYIIRKWQGRQSQP
jgi:peptidoglycan/xylan/chitin deacetylase (PgdA/CDA1 family)